MAARPRLNVILAIAVAALLLWYGSAQLAPPPAQARETACEGTVFEGRRFTVCRFDRALDEMRLVVNNGAGVPLRSLASLGAALGVDADDVRFAMNAGMYDADGRPIGLYVENGALLRSANTRDGTGNFHLKPNGVFSVDGDGIAHVETTEAYVSRSPSPRWATQSGPMLVIAGAIHPEFQPDGPSRLIRNGVGIGKSGAVIFAISEEAVSFGRFARLFRDELGCDDALYLDGVVSSLWDPSRNRMDDRAPLGPMAVVLGRPTS